MVRTLAIHLRSLFRRQVVDRDLDEELQSHVDRAIARNIAHGMTASDAHAAASREFGNITAITEAARDAWRWQWINRCVRTSATPYAPCDGGRRSRLSPCHPSR